MKFLKILFFNLTLIFIFLVLIEVYISRNNYVNSIKSWKDVVINTISADEYYDNMFKYKDFNYYARTPKFRPDININSDKKPILFMGCSFTYGTALEDNETISYKMAKLTNRPVYNRGAQGWGLNQFLYMLRRNDFYSYFKEEPEYLIYIFISDHMNRLDRYKVMPMEGVFQPVFKKRGDTLIEIKPKLWDRLVSSTYIQSNYNYWHSRVSEDDVKLYFIEAKKALRKQWKNTKLVILVYPLYYNCSKNLWRELEIEGYKIIYIKDLIDIDLTNPINCAKDGEHPSSSTWDIVVPKIIKILGIK